MGGGREEGGPGIGIVNHVRTRRRRGRRRRRERKERRKGRRGRRRSGGGTRRSGDRHIGKKGQPKRDDQDGYDEGGREGGRKGGPVWPPSPYTACCP